MNPPPRRTRHGHFQPLPAVWCAAAMIMSAPAVSSAQARDTVPRDSAMVRLTGISVRALTPAVTAGGTSALRVVLDSLALPASATVEDLLREIPLLHVRRNSRGEAELTARGSESRQVAVLVDGVPLTLGWDARSDMSVLPATAPVQVTLLRGLSSMLHGPNVLAGAIELAVAGEHVPANRSADVSATVDHVRGWGVSGQATLPLNGFSGKWLLRGGGGYRDSPGAPLARGVREPLSRTDELRLNTDARSIDAFAAARYHADGGQWVSASAFGFSARRGVAAELDNTQPRFWRYPYMHRAVATLSGGTGFHNTPFGTGDLEASIGLDFGRTEIDAYGSRAYDEIVAFEDGTDRTVTLRLVGDHSLGPKTDLAAAFTLADISHTEQLPGDTARYRQRLYSFGAESTTRVPGTLGMLRNLRISVGAALDAGSTPEAGGRIPLPTIRDWGGRAGASVTTASGQVQLHAGISRRGRFPALRETFSGAIDRFVPNPALSPEHLIAVETGVTTAMGSGSLQVVVFHHRLDDVIVRITLPDRRFQRVNENEMRSTGIELLGSQTLGPIGVTGDVKWQSVQLIEPAQRLGHLENQPEIAAGIQTDVRLPLDVALTAEARYTGVQHCLASTGEDVKLAGRTKVNGSLGRSFSIPSRENGPFSRMQARISADNVGDVAIHDQCGLPQPGRLLRLQLRVF